MIPMPESRAKPRLSVENISSGTKPDSLRKAFERKVPAEKIISVVLKHDSELQESLYGWEYFKDCIATMGGLAVNGEIVDVRKIRETNPNRNSTAYANFSKTLGPTSPDEYSLF